MKKMPASIFCKNIVVLHKLIAQIGLFRIFLGLMLLTNLPNIHSQNCSNVLIEPGKNQIKISNLFAPIKIVEVYDSEWNFAFRCEGNECDTEQIITGLKPETHFVKVTLYEEGWKFFCALDNIPVEVEGCNPSYCEGDILLRTQAEVDAFCGCEIIEGDLTLFSDTINNLNALKGLKQIVGQLSIIDTRVTDLSGLDSLERIESELIIVQNPLLSKLTGLEKLNTVKDRLIIEYCPLINDLDALESLKLLGGIIISDNEKLNSLQGLKQIKTLDNLTLTVLGQLTTLEGLENLRIITGSATIGGNPTLLNLDALQNLKSVNSKGNNSDFALTIGGNEKLSNCCGIRHLIDGDENNGKIGTGEVRFFDNPAFCNSVETILDYCPPIIPPCNGMEITGGEAQINISSLFAPNKIIEIYNSNWNLVYRCAGKDCHTEPTINGLDYGTYFVKVSLFKEDWTLICQSDNVVVEVEGCASICKGSFTLNTQAEVDAFCGCEIIEGDLRIFSEKISNLHGLKSLKSVHGNFFISSSTQLANLSGLDNLEEIRGAFIIDYNSSLKDLKGLEKLNLIGDVLIIKSCPLLLNIDALKSLNSLGELRLMLNKKLNSLKGLEQIETLEKSLFLVQNESLESLEGLNNLLEVGGIMIGGNDALSNIDALNNIKTVNKPKQESPFNNTIDIVGNTRLSSCCGIAHLVDGDTLNGKVIEGEVFIRENTNFCNSIEEILSTCTDITPPSCNDVIIEGKADEIIISELTAPNSIIEVFDFNWNPIFRCIGSDCSSKEVITNLNEDTYRVNIQFYERDWNPICSRQNILVELDSNNSINCDKVVVSGNDETINILGLNAPIEIVQVFDLDNDWQKAYYCQADCEDALTIPNLTSNNYVVKVQMYDKDWGWVCESNIEFTFEDGASSRVVDKKLSELIKENRGLKIYPNPANHMIKLDTKDIKGKIGFIKIDNIYGQVIKEIDNQEFDAFYKTIDVNSFENGLYWLSVKVNGLPLITNRFVVENLR